jgi:hypothetical protein
MGCDAVKSVEGQLMFRRNVLLPTSGSKSKPSNRQGATGSEIQFFQKCKWSWNEQNHIGEVGDDSFTVHTHQTLI